jgi:hypothetical protein
MKLAIVKYTDLVFSIALMALGLLSLRYIKDIAAAAGLGGALFGAAAVLSGNWINRWYESRQGVEELTQRRTSLMKLITAELVTTAVGYLNAKRELDLALHPLASLTDFRSALVTLQGCIAMTRMNVERAIEEGRLAVRSRVIEIDQVTSHDMGILAQCFEKIAPARKLQMPDKEPELASALLRRAATSQAKRGELAEWMNQN